MSDILIAPVGLEFDRVIESVQFVAVTKIYLLRDTESKNNQKEPELLEFTNKFFNKIHDRWKSFYKKKLITVEIDFTNLDRIIETISTIIIEELSIDKACRIYVNISTTTKLFGVILCNIASFYPRNIIPFYLSTSNYLLPKIISQKCDIKEFEEHGLTKGPYKMVEIPVLPHIEIKPIAKQILKALYRADEYQSFNFHQITEKLGYNYNEQKDRQKVSYWVKKLEEYYFIADRREKNRHNVRITDKGVLFVKLFRFLKR